MSGRGQASRRNRSEQRVLGRGLCALTRLGSTHSSHRPFRHILRSGLHFLFFFFFNASSPKHFSCHVMFSLVLFSPALTLTDLLYLILGISLINILREKKINLPGVSVVLIELWFSALEERKEKKITRSKYWISDVLLTIVTSGKWI